MRDWGNHRARLSCTAPCPHLLTRWRCVRAAKSPESALLHLQGAFGRRWRSPPRAYSHTPGPLSPMRLGQRAITLAIVAVRIGERVWVVGGYYGANPCTGGDQGLYGVVTGFENGDGASRCVVLLDHWAECQSSATRDQLVSYKWLICTRRHHGAEWDHDAAVHVEISDVDPLAHTLHHTKNRHWVEGAATLRVTPPTGAD